jgi:hypothetical protein
MMSRLRIAFTLAAVLMLALAGSADEPLSNLKFLVLKDYNGKPIRSASVVLHPVDGSGKQKKNGFELKTNENGETSFDGVPYGKLRIQVLVPGFQTFGEDYEINQPEQQITIRLKRPQKQYSIYDK